MTYPLDQRNQADGLSLLRATTDEYTPLVIFDPQYRQVLDKLAFGNEGERQKGRAQLAQMSPADITAFGIEIARILKPNGYVALWCDKLVAFSGTIPQYFGGALALKDVLTWDKGKIGMGYRTRRRAEYIAFLQKPPGTTKSWKRQPMIPDVVAEKITDRRHTHQKPSGLHRALIEALTEPGDVIVNPCAGSFAVMDTALACGRHFLGCDISTVRKVP
jgi:site-specific DNA-methyltransferase (adenine-specific)